MSSPCGTRASRASRVARSIELNQITATSRVHAVYVDFFLFRSHVNVLGKTTASLARPSHTNNLPDLFNLVPVKGRNGGESLTGFISWSQRINELGKDVGQSRAARKRAQALPSPIRAIHLRINCL